MRFVKSGQKMIWTQKTMHMKCLSLFVIKIKMCWCWMREDIVRWNNKLIYYIQKRF
jgi:hypothetical protein